MRLNKLTKRSHKKKKKRSQGTRDLHGEVTMAALPVKRRRPNVSNEELIVLLRDLTERKTIIMGKLDSTRVTKEGKNNAWVAVTEAVNVVSPVRRTEDEVRKKFYDRSLTKKKISDARQEMLRIGKFVTDVMRSQFDTLTSVQCASGLTLVCLPA